VRFRAARFRPVPDCRDAAIARTVERINNSRLSALHANRRSTLS
jgi:hypothetical protein